MTLQRWGKTDRNRRIIELRAQGVEWQAIADRCGTTVTNCRNVISAEKRRQSATKMTQTEQPSAQNQNHNRY